MNDEDGRHYPLDAALDRWSHDAVPPEVAARLRGDMDRFRERLDSGAAVSNPPRRIRRFVPAMIGGAVAASLLAAAVFFALGSRDAWAQVAKSIQAKPWVRWTLQIPAEAAASGEVPPEVLKQPPEIWFSMQHKSAASRFLQAVHFLDFAKQESYRYEPADQTLYHASASDFDTDFFEQTGALLRLAAVGTPNLKLPDSPIKLIEQTQREVREGERIWSDFTFKFEDRRRTPPEYVTTIRVDAETRLPVRMTEQMTGGEKPIVRTFVFDYPETGPADVYALGVPRTAKIVDSRLPGGAKEVAAAHAKAAARPIDRYSAIVLMTHPKSDWKDILTAHRAQYDGKTWQLAWSDPMALLEFRQKVWAKEIEIPKDADPALWWKEAVSELPFEPMTEIEHPSGHHGFPDHVGYYRMGDVALSAKPVLFDRRPTAGPPDTVLLKIDGVVSNAFWLAPANDYLALRFECPSGDVSEWKLQVTVVDKVEKSPGGRWYTTESRVGRIRNSGEDPPAEMGVAPVTTSVYRYFVEFE